MLSRLKGRSWTTLKTNCGDSIKESLSSSGNSVHSICKTRQKIAIRTQIVGKPKLCSAFDPVIDKQAMNEPFEMSPRREILFKPQGGATCPPLSGEKLSDQSRSCLVSGFLPPTHGSGNE